MERVKEVIMDKLLLGAFLANIAYTIGYPTIQEVTMKAADSRLISLVSFIGCGGIVLVGQIWDKIGEEKLMKFFPTYAIGDIVSYTILCSIFMTTGNAKIYYLGQVVCSILTIKNVGFGLSFIRSKRYKENKRAKYDNLAAVLESVASLVGFGIAAVVKIPLMPSVVLMGLGTLNRKLLHDKSLLRNKITLAV